MIVGLTLVLCVGVGGVYHPGIRCYECEEEPIRGKRYLCKEPGCDLKASLCSTCYESNKGIPTHMYAVLDSPVAFQEFLPPRLDEDEPYHPQVMCVGCGESPIVGTRWMCAERSCHPHISVCSSCYEDGQHATSHAFYKLETPMSQKIAVPPRS